MGYLTYVSGEIAIVPPLRWVDIKDSPFLPGENGWPDRDLAIRVQESTVETDDGTLTYREGVAVTQASDDRYKTYSVEAHLQELLDQFQGDGRRWDGYLEGDGDDSGDMWRLYVRDGKAVMVKVQLVWPEGTPGGAS